MAPSLMRRCLGIALVLLTHGVVAAEAQPISRWYGVVGPYFRKGPNVEAGVGGRIGVWNGVGTFAEFAVLTGDLLDARVVSVGLSYDVLSARSDRKTIPFATLGYSRMAGDIILHGQGGAKNFINISAGLNHWFSDRIGLMFEVRDYVNVQHRKTDMPGFRVGVGVRFRRTQ